MTDPEPPVTTWRSTVRERANAALPFGSPQRRVARLALQTYRQTRNAGGQIAQFWDLTRVSFGSSFAYGDWLATQRVTGEALPGLLEHAERPVSFGLTVVVLPGTGPVDDTLSSLAEQYRPAEVVVRHDRRAAGTDPSADMVLLAEALADAPDDHVVMCLRAGDRLEADAVLRITDRLDADPRAVLLTWDDDVLVRGEPAEPLFHPMTFSPDLLLSAFPHGRSLALRADAVRAAGGLDPDWGADAVWELVLRMGLVESDVVHLPRVLSHLAGRPAAVGARGPELVARHLERLGLAASTRRAFGAVRVRWDPAERPRVSVLVPTRHNTELMAPLLASLARTDYPDWELVVVDNGGRGESHERFYAEHAADIDHTVIWWDEPFNYGTVNNTAARAATGEVLVLLNDDTVVHSPDWLDELVGWLGVPGVGTVGVQMIDPDGNIQHGGAIVGAAGLADHRFQGMAPHSDTILGSTDWYRDSVANTGACVAIRRELWDDIGGLDERFELCGSDVVLGIEARHRGLRNVCTAAIHVDHLESATRRTTVPQGDIFASYWRYARLLKAGDEYHNPNVSLMSRVPALRAPDEPTALDRVGPSVGRSFGGAFEQSASSAEALAFGEQCRADDALVGSIAQLHAATAEGIDVRTVNWFVPFFDNPFYGGLATIFRIADHLRRHHGVQNRFVVWGPENPEWIRSGLAAVFPGLEESEVLFCEDLLPESVADLPAADVAIATQWQTAYQVAHFPHARRKWYLVQDFEPVFNPAGTLYALAEETYRLGLLTLCNTDHLLELVSERYGARGASFMPAVDDRVFHARTRTERTEGPVNVFVYARPGHWRNCWELAAPALRQVKERFGRDVRIVTAGAWTSNADLTGGLDHLGLLDYVDTGELYRSCDLGVSLTVSEHPSYLPLELTSCGAPVVAFDLPAGYWILRDRENSLLARRTVDSLAERIGELVADAELRRRLSRGGLDLIERHHASWDANLAGIHAALGAPLADTGAESGAEYSDSHV